MEVANFSLTSATTEKVEFSVHYNVDAAKSGVSQVYEQYLENKGEGRRRGWGRGEGGKRKERGRGEKRIRARKDRRRGAKNISLLFILIVQDTLSTPLISHKRHK